MRYTWRPKIGIVLNWEPGEEKDGLVVMDVLADGFLANEETKKIGISLKRLVNNIKREMGQYGNA